MYFRVKDLMYIMIKINLAGKNTIISVYWLECVYLITYKADDGEPRATRLSAPLERALTTGWDFGRVIIFRTSRYRNLSIL